MEKSYSYREVQLAKAEALEQAAHDLGWLGAQGNLVEPDTAWAGISACRTSLRAVAEDIRKKLDTQEPCGHDGGTGIGAGHSCVCLGKKGHEPYYGIGHGCSCGALWREKA